jgi:p-cumate 2,3-dioxygenase beta subunit
MSPISRSEAEDFLYREAYLLDSRQFQAWENLFLPEARYVVPSTDLNDEPPEAGLYLVADDRQQISFRVARLGKSNAHAEQPASLTRRLVSNVLVLEANPDQGVIHAAFVMYRTRAEITDTYVGHYHHRVRRAEGGLRFVERRVVLDMFGLRPVGVISTII